MAAPNQLANPGQLKPGLDVVSILHSLAPEAGLVRLLGPLGFAFCGVPLKKLLQKYTRTGNEVFVSAGSWDYGTYSQLP